jgi:hypothetical protein
MGDVTPVCECLARVRDLPSCPAHGVFPTASKRIELEAEVKRLRDLAQFRYEQGGEYLNERDAARAKVERLRTVIQEALDYPAVGTPAGWGRRARKALDA